MAARSWTYHANVHGSFVVDEDGVGDVNASSAVAEQAVMVAVEESEAVKPRAVCMSIAVSQVDAM